MEGDEVHDTSTAPDNEGDRDEYAELIRILKTDAEDFNPDA